MGVAILVVLAVMAISLARHERVMQLRRGEPPSLPWNPAWPAMPMPFQGVRKDVARALYAFAGTKPELLHYIPCYCGCRLQGHHSNHDCFVKQRSTSGVVTEWDGHGLACPFAGDITGDVMLLHEQGKSLQVIRRQIDREFGGRGEATDTPLPN
jgi:hypothetical protein